MTSDPTPFGAFHRSPNPQRHPRQDLHPERTELLRQAAAAAIAASGGVTCLLLFFFAIGSVNLGDAVVAFLVVLLLGCIWIGGVLYARRHEGFRLSKADRERRGF